MPVRPRPGTRPEAGLKDPRKIADHAVGDQPATPRFCMRAHRMSPKMPASVTPMASTTAMHPAGMA